MLHSQIGNTQAQNETQSHSKIFEFQFAITLASPIDSKKLKKSGQSKEFDETFSENTFP
jgi:hypothetical protein